MRNKILLRLLMATALLILAVPVVASAQFYNRDDRRDDRRDARQAISRLETASAQLQGDLNVRRSRSVFGFWMGNNNSAAVDQVRNFRLAVRDLRVASNRGRNLRDSEDEARTVINLGLQLDRYLRLRTGSANVDADLAELRSGLNQLVDAYDLRVRY